MIALLGWKLNNLGFCLSLLFLLENKRITLEHLSKTCGGKKTDIIVIISYSGMIITKRGT